MIANCNNVPSNLADYIEDAQVQEHTLGALRERIFWTVLTIGL